MFYLFTLIQGATPYRFASYCIQQIPDIAGLPDCERGQYNKSCFRLQDQ